MSGALEWRLRRSYASSEGQVAHDVLGEGPPLVLVHGTPSWSYLWRHVAPHLAENFTVHVYDLVGYGSSERHEGQDVSIPAQGRVLGELLDLWGLDEPCVVGHDIGGAIALRVLFSEQQRIRCLALCDAVAITPWITPFTRHVQRYLEAFQTLPHHMHEQMVATHLRTAIAKPMCDEQLEPYLAPWLGADGQAAYYRQVAQLDEAYTRDIMPRYQEIDIPTFVLWGDQDEWLPPSMGQHLADTIPGARLAWITAAGHFAPEDQPDEIATQLAGFFSEQC